VAGLQTLVDARTGEAQPLAAGLKGLIQDPATQAIDLLHYRTERRVLEELGVLASRRPVRLLLVMPDGCSREDIVELAEAKLPSNVQIRAVDRLDPRQSLHSKLVILDREDGAVAVVGSANCTGAGYGLRAAPGNIELGTLVPASDPIRAHFEDHWAAADPEKWRDPTKWLAQEVLKDPCVESPMFRLLDYQTQAVAEIAEAFRKAPRRPADRRGALLRLPTGAGKTVVVLRFLADAVFGRPEEHRPVLWLAHHDELNLQVMGAAHRQLLLLCPNVRVQTEADYLESKRRAPSAEVAGTWNLLFRTPQAEKKHPMPDDGYAAVVVDEAHHGTGSGQMTEDLLRERFWETFRLGMTATPYRAADRFSPVRLFGKQLVPEDDALTDRRRLIAYEDSRFGTVQVLAEVEEEGLGRDFYQKVEVPFRIDWTERGLGTASDHPLEKAAKGRPFREAVARHWQPRFGQTLVFAFDHQHANDLARAFRQAHPGVALQVVHTGRVAAGCDLVQEPAGRGRRLSTHQRELVRRQFLDKKIQVLISVDIYIAGMDFPAVETISMARPTFSSVRYNQIIGRGLRGPDFKGTRKLRVIDYCDQGRAHALSTRYLMTLHKALAAGDHREGQPILERLLRPPRVLSAERQERAPRKRGVWAVYTPAGKQGKWRWDNPASDLRAAFQSAKGRMGLTRRHWLVFHVLSDGTDAKTVKRVLKTPALRKEIEDNAQRALDQTIARRGSR